MRDFYIYGFKVRGDFKTKSARTYDNEKRRIESYLAPYVRWENDKRGKRVYVSLDTADIGCNPLYNAWKAKSFTDNDITLHFAILYALQGGQMGITELTDRVCGLTGTVFEAQTVRLKANEYVREGLLYKEVRKKTDYYSLSHLTLSALPAEREMLLAAICFFQEAAPFGFVGSTLLDQEKEKAEAEEAAFGFKHHYIVHTLEDGMLYDLLRAVHEKRRVSFTQQSTRYAKETVQDGIPLQVFVSVQSGRRYVCMYVERNRSFHNFRLDYIKKVTIGDCFAEYDAVRDMLENAKQFCWGVSFGASKRKQTLQMKLHIDEERERYVLERLRREGRNGETEKIGLNTFLYTATLYDTAEMLTWVKTFTGRILSLEGSNQEVVNRFYRDMARMAALYGGGS